jgi:nicotinate-nucleotide pyrophosphorylase (carboxylating)
VARATAEVTLKQDALICGLAWFEETFRQLDDGIAFEWSCRDGDRLARGTLVCRIRGPARALLTGERTALNFLQTLSATATSARAYVDAVAGTNATILDTRKTIPGLRSAQKYAVRCAGASNHRIGLFDAILIKENHIAAVGSIDAAIEKAHVTEGSVLIEVEVETMEQVERALASRAHRLLLDDFSLDMMHEAVRLRDAIARDKGASPKRLEASGGVTLDNVRAIAETGVDYISVGAMTKSIAAVDLSLRIVTGV